MTCCGASITANFSNYRFQLHPVPGATGAGTYFANTATAGLQTG